MKSLEELKKLRDESIKNIEMRNTDKDVRVVVGMATCGISAGARPVLATFVEEVAKRNLNNVSVVQTLSLIHISTNVNLCTALALKGKKVLSIDIDPQGNTTSGFGFNKNKLEYTIYNVLIEDYDINKIIFKTEIENLDITPANIQLAGAEIELTNTKFREKTLREKINLIENKYDFIMVDCPPSLGLLSLNALTASNTVLIPIPVSYTHLIIKLRFWTV